MSRNVLTNTWQEQFYMDFNFTQFNSDNNAVRIVAQNGLMEVQKDDGSTPMKELININYLLDMAPDSSMLDAVQTFSLSSNPTINNFNASLNMDFPTFSLMGGMLNLTFDNSILSIISDGIFVNEPFEGAFMLGNYPGSGLEDQTIILSTILAFKASKAYV